MNGDNVVQVSVNPGEGLSIARGGGFVTFGRTVAEATRDSEDYLAEAIGTSIVCQLARFLAGRGLSLRVHVSVTGAIGGELEPRARVGISVPSLPPQLADELLAEAGRAPAVAALRARPEIWFSR
jgi:hypothetical protein